MRTTLVLGCCTLLAATFGCRSTTTHFQVDQPQVKDSLLVHVPAEQQQRITEVRQQRTQLEEQLKVARNDLAEAKSLYKLSQEDIAALKTRLDAADNQVDYARRYRDNDAFDKAQAERNDAQAAVRLAMAQSRYHDDLRLLAEQRIDLLQERIALAEARYELAKAKAVSELDRPVAEQVDVGDHRRAVQLQADNVEAARIETLVARQRVELQRELVQRNGRDVPDGLRLRQIEALEAVFDSQALEDEKTELDDDEMAPVKRDHEARDGSGREGATHEGEPMKQKGEPDTKGDPNTPPARRGGDGR